MSLEDIVKSLATNTQSFQQETKASIKNLEHQMAQLATSVSRLESQGKLAAQTEKNQRHNVCAITLRGGKSYDDPPISVDQEKEEEIVVNKSSNEEENKEKSNKKKLATTEVKYTPVAPFPERLVSTKKEREESEIMQMFQKVHVNIPLLDVIKQVPRYAKFLKELCISKKKLKGTLSKTGVIIQLANRSIVHPKGVLEDVLVQVNELIFPADFYVLVMGDDDSPNSSSILLGRPFLKTTKTKIDVYNGTLSMEFDGEVINFNIIEEKRYPNDEIPEKLKLDKEMLVNVEFIDEKKNIRFHEMGIHQKLKIQELEEIKNEAFESSHIYKDKTKAFHDKYLSRKIFEIGQKVLLYDSRFKWFFGKLRSRWIGPFIVTNIFDHDAIEIKSNKTGKVFKVNGHRLKVFYEGFREKDMEVDSLECPDYIE
ncbi:uncharacterized protein LOC111902501 [Lactuca sativa]|uniref:uncharacterized protein LOC111902501 n=1 Tax=Lactuca sativa TaxID=4236 RepID=UPI001C68E2D8|nr:uncharacterized protein LOC111902501 [Lactuca sativa]